MSFITHSLDMLARAFTIFLAVTFRKRGCFDRTHRARNIRASPLLYAKPEDEFFFFFFLLVSTRQMNILLFYIGGTCACLFIICNKKFNGNKFYVFSRYISYTLQK